MERDYKKIYKDILLDGLFSEYLPPCFKLDERMFCNIPENNCDLIQPYSFTMSRFNTNDSRRTIFIPEIGAHAVLNHYIEENKILEEILNFIDDDEFSFSKIIMDDGSIRKHEQVYGIEIAKDEKINSQYIDNVVKKLIISAGAKKVLKLDIANCFSSFYTHYIPAIILGYEIAEKNYNKSLKKKNNKDEEVDEIDEKYKIYSELDKIIRKQNKNQTNGLLVGPIISKIIVEGLLSRIDLELKEKGVLFTRYVDDYEVYLFEDNEDYLKNIFVSILKKYGLSLNFEKIELVDFPYYMVKNFDKIIEQYRDKKVEDYDLIQLFNTFFEIEKFGTKGAIRYLLKSLEKELIDVENRELFNSYILTIMSNNPRSLTKACSLFIKNKNDVRLDENHIKRIKEMLELNLEKHYDLEVIWLLYILIETDNTDKIVKDDTILNKVLKSDNELAILMLLRKSLISDSDIDAIKQNAKSWILNYELFAMNSISMEELSDRIPIIKNKKMYEKLKEQNLHFCY